MGKSAETKKKIIAKTIELAQKLGPNEVSVKLICEAVEISKNTFYQYFSNKEDVFGETYSTSDEEKMSALAGILLNFDSPLEQFWEFCKIDIERQMSFGPKLLGTIATQNVMHDSFYIETEENLSPAIDVSLSMIKKMQRCGEVANQAEPFLLMRTLYCSAIGIDIRWTKQDGSFDLKKEMYEQMMAILQPTKEITNY